MLHVNRMRLALLQLIVGMTTLSAARGGEVRPGRVTLNDHTLCDDDGEFLGMGASYFPALRRVKFDRARYRNDLDFLSRQRFNYIRTLSMVGWYPAWKGKEIAPVTFKNKRGEIIDGWDDYWQQLGQMIDIAYDEFGIRSQITIFADAQLMPDKADRLRHIEKLLEAIRSREHKVILLEVANEAWQNGFSGPQGVSDLREFGKYLNDRTEILVALSATDGHTERGLRELYLGSAADIATEHFSRDIRTAEGGWLPVRDVYCVNSIANLPPAASNEPIGPASSVAAENDPIKLVSAAAYAWMSGLPMYVYHTRAGVFGEDRFEDMAGAGDYRHLLKILPRDIANWRHTESDADFAPFVTGERAVRHLCCVKGNEFYTLPIGISAGGLQLQARRDMTIEVFNPLTGKVVLQASIAATQKITLPQGPHAYLIHGRFTK